MLVETDHLLPISEASAKGLSKIVSDAEGGHEWVLLRNSKPVAAVVGMGKLERLQQLEDVEDDLRLMALALARTVTDNGNRTSFGKVLAHFGLDEDDLVAVDD
jgi:hypothetical protein